jgi:hypothetical protein
MATETAVSILTATAQSITVLLGDGEGFTPAAGSPYGPVPGTYRLAIGDIDNDGKLDLAGSNFGGDSVTLLGQ